MPKKGYSHLTLELRCHIFVLSAKCSQIEIAKQLNISQPTVSRELSRNRIGKKYDFALAHKKAIKRRLQASSTPKKITHELAAHITKKITEEQWSPEQISGRLKNEGVKISFQSIYRYTRKNKIAEVWLHKKLRRAGKPYNKNNGKISGRGIIPDRVGIEKRPVEVELKQRFGDFEGDTVVGAHHKGAIVTMVDRKTKLAKFYLLQSANAKDTADATIKMLKPWKKWMKTITSDNGKEFAEHKKVAKKLKIEFFFARLSSPQDRGVNENTNGLLREYFPKGSDFTKLTQSDVFAVEKKLNNRPRKTLNYLTPNEMFLSITTMNAHYALQS